MNTQKIPSFQALPNSLKGGRMSFVRSGGYFIMEQWKDIKGYEGIYKISRNGIIKSIDHLIKCSNGRQRIQKGRVLKVHICYKGYLRVSLSKKTKRFSTSVHRLLALHFIENKFNKPQVNHMNGIKSDNRIGNLEWCTNAENQIHAVKNGLINPNYGENHHNSKLSNEEVRKARKLRANGLTITRLAKIYTVSIAAMSKILSKQTYINL